MEGFNHNIRYFLVPIDPTAGIADEDQFCSAINKILIQKLFYFTQAQYKHQNRKVKKIILKCEFSKSCQFEYQLKLLGKCQAIKQNEDSENNTDNFKFLCIIMGQNLNQHFQLPNKLENFKSFDEILNSDIHISQIFKISQIDPSDYQNLLQRIPHPNYIYDENSKIIYQIDLSKLPDIQQLIISSQRQDFCINHFSHVVKCESFMKKLQNQEILQNNQIIKELIMDGFGNLCVNIIEEGKFSDFQKPHIFQSKNIWVSFQSQEIQMENNQEISEMSIELFQDEILEEFSNIFFPILTSFVKIISGQNIQKIVSITEQKLDFQIIHLQKRKICINKQFSEFKNQNSLQRYNYLLRRQEDDAVEKEIIQEFDESILTCPITTLQILENKINETNIIISNITNKEDQLNEKYAQKAQILAEIDLLEKDIKQDKKALEHKLQVCSRLDHYRDKFFRKLEIQALKSYQVEISFQQRQIIQQLQPNLLDQEVIRTGYFEKILQEEQNQMGSLDEEINQSNFETQNNIGDEVLSTINNYQFSTNIEECEENESTKISQSSKKIKKNKLKKPSTITDNQWKQINQMKDSVKKAKKQLQINKIKSEIEK